MSAKFSQAFLIFSIFVLILTIAWLVYPSPYRVCHFVITGMGRARLYPYTAKFKPYKGKTMGGAALMGAVVKEQIASFTAKKEPHCFVSLGTELSGTAESFFTKGEAIAKAYDALKLDAMLIGNIDFSYGKERLSELSKLINFKFLSSNIVDETNNNTPDYFSEDCIIKTPYDFNIGLLGITPTDTPNLVSKENISGLKILEPSDILQAKVNNLRQKGADIVALLTEYNKETITPNEWLTIASAAPDICFMLDNDIEAPIPFVKDGIIVYSISSYNQTKEIDVLNLQITKSKPIEIVGVASERIATNMAEYEEDSSVAQVVDNATADIRARRDTVIGRFAKDYAKSFYSECPFGNFVADVMLAETKADVAMQNSGGIHASVSEGDFTNGDLYTILPFHNKVVTLNLKGSDILELLNISASRRRGILQVSGIEYEYSYKNKNDYKLLNAKINGKDIEPEQIYKVATNKFLADGGDNYIPFTRGENLEIIRSQRDILKDYIASLSIEAPIELKLDGRIKVFE